MLRLLMLVFFLESTVGKLSPHFLEGCGGWQQCLGTHVDSEEPLGWFEGWNSTIQPKLDLLLAKSSELQEEGWAKNHGLLLVIAGDSTMIQQFQLLSEFVNQRSDFQPIKGPDAERRKNYMVTFGAPENAPGSVTFAFYRVFEACMLGPANPLLKTAYAHYFGCGMHLLHLIPVQGPPMLSQALESWYSYDKLLETRVRAIKEVNPKIKQVFCSTHTIDESKYVGDWLDTLKGYERRDPEYLNKCKSKFDVNLPNNSPLRGDIEQACVNSVFGRRGVELLNKRGLAAMEAAGVPTVPAHTLVDGQSWATPAGDGRHYPYLVPMELLMFLNTLEGMQS
ncbi:unnamed protein product [Ascophyllum nodosum]